MLCNAVLLIYILSANRGSARGDATKNKTIHNLNSWNIGSSADVSSSYTQTRVIQVFKCGEIGSRKANF